MASGLGSGAAVSVAVIRALADILGQTLPDEQVSALAFEVEKLHHGTPSGIDNTVITYARPVYFIKGQPIEILTPGAPFFLVIGDTGIPAPTKESVADVRRLWQAQPARIDPLLDAIGDLSAAARGNLLSGDWQALGALMNANHALLQELTVSCPALDSLVAGCHGQRRPGGKAERRWARREHGRPGGKGKRPRCGRGVKKSGGKRNHHHPRGMITV